MHAIVENASKTTGVAIEAIDTGLTPEGVDIGSPSMDALRMPKVLLVVGDGVTSYDAGEVWHLLDQRYGMPVSMIETGDIASRNLDRYNVIIMVNGGYYRLGENGSNKIKKWVEAGGTLVAYRGAAQWAAGQGIAKTKTKSNNKNGDKDKKPSPPERKPYLKVGTTSGAQVIGGAIFETQLDLGHPLTYGYSSVYTSSIPSRGTLLLRITTKCLCQPISIYG